MALSLKLFSVVLLIVFITIIQAKPSEESKSVAESGDEEMMETAESQNPFLPRFAMRKLKDRREKDRAQRRNQGGQGFRRNNQYYGSYQGGWNRPYGVSCSHYKK